MTACCLSPSISLLAGHNRRLLVVRSSGAPRWLGARCASAMVPKGGLGQELVDPAHAEKPTKGAAAAVAEVIEEAEVAEAAEVVVPVTKPLQFPSIKRNDPMLRPWIAGFADPEESLRTRWSRRSLWLMLALVASIIAWDVDRRVWSDGHTWSTALMQYFWSKFMITAGRWRLHVFLAEVHNAEAVQRRLFTQLLTRETRYSRKHGLNSMTSFEEFRQKHPITVHADYAEYIADSCAEEERVLATVFPASLSMTSCTCREPNRTPHAEDMSKTFFIRGVCVAFGVLGAHYPAAVNNLQCSAKLNLETSCGSSSSGRERGSKQFSLHDWWFRNTLDFSASPLAAYQIQYEADALYAHTLFALKDRNLGMLEACYAPLLCLMLDTARENRKSLVQDLRNGHIWDRRMISGAANLAVREAIDGKLDGPHPKRAAEVERLLREGACAEKLWPNLRLVMTADGGALAPSAAQLQSLLGHNLPVYSPFYIAAEGLLGINVTPERPFGISTYVLDPGSMVFELLPMEWHDVEQPPTYAPLLPWEAKIGSTYEVIITTRGGLCRYRLGDIVRVYGHMGQMPIVAVEERGAHK